MYHYIYISIYIYINIYISIYIYISVYISIGAVFCFFFPTLHMFQVSLKHPQTMFLKLQDEEEQGRAIRPFYAG